MGNHWVFKMSLLTDVQLDSWLNSWAVWRVAGKPIVRSGCRPASFDHSASSGNRLNHDNILNHELERCIERVVATLAEFNRTAADVGRLEYGALLDSWDLRYDNMPSIEVRAARLSEYYRAKGILLDNEEIKRSAYKYQLGKFREWMRASMSTRQLMLAG